MKTASQTVNVIKAHLVERKKKWLAASLVCSILFVSPQLIAGSSRSVSVPPPPPPSATQDFFANTAFTAVAAGGVAFTTTAPLNVAGVQRSKVTNATFNCTADGSNPATQVWCYNPGNPTEDFTTCIDQSGTSTMVHDPSSTPNAICATLNGGTSVMENTGDVTAWYTNS